MASTVSNGNDRSEKWQRPFTKGKFASSSSTTWADDDDDDDDDNCIVMA